MVCHAQKVVDQMFQGCQCILQERLPLRFPILQDLVREAPPHAKDTTPSKYLWGIRQRFRLLATADPITTNLLKKTLEWPVSLNTLDLKRKHQQLQFRQCKSCVNLPGI